MIRENTNYPNFFSIWGIFKWYGKYDINVCGSNKYHQWIDPSDIVIMWLLLSLILSYTPTSNTSPKQRHHQHGNKFAIKSSDWHLSARWKVLLFRFTFVFYTADCLHNSMDCFERVWKETVDDWHRKVRVSVCKAHSLKLAVFSDFHLIRIASDNRIWCHDNLSIPARRFN